MQFVPGQRIHCIGIGGFGISAIARVLLLRGFPISGSDRSSNALTGALARDGATIYHGHAAEYVGNADLVIATSAVHDDHVEIVAARERGIPVYRRREILAALMNGQTVIAVAGTHGKTTTTAMIVHILRECGQGPSYIVGGIMANTGTNAGVGQGEMFVIEADEYDNMFLGLNPDIAVMTGVEYDHPDFFKSEAEMIEIFRQFAELLTEEGELIVCGHDPVARSFAEARQHSGQPAFVYGLDGMDWGAENIVFGEDGQTTFVIRDVSESTPISVILTVPGKYNVLNALAAMRAVKKYVPYSESAAALKTFQSTGRRFEIRGEIDGVTVIDDYAHHPTAIRVTLEAARLRYPQHKIWAIWQPHMFSRTQKLSAGYAKAFVAADHVVVTDIYAAREDPIPGVDGAWTASQIQHADARHIPTLADVVEMLSREVVPPAVILIMSAGDAPQVGSDYLRTKRN